MQPTPPFTAAIFDLDGTVSDSSPLHWRSFNIVLKPYGVQISRETWLTIYEGTGAKHIFEDVLVKHGLGTVDVEALRAKRHPVFQEIALNELLPVHGFGRFYDQLKELNVPTIIATNAEDHTIKISLEILKLQDEPIVNTAQVGNKVKPDPAVYLLACRTLGKKPAECVVFEDSYSGVLAAKRAGCYCVALLTTTARDVLEGAGADMVIRDFAELTPSMLFVVQRPKRMGDVK